MFDTILDKINTIASGVPAIVLIIVTGIVLTIRTRGIQFTKLRRAFQQIFKKNDGHGELTGFSALCTALSTTIGTGNIIGVATAVASGGPGALLWMWLAAILGTATKFSECMLAIKYREVKEDGHVLGGPFYTIEKGMGSKWKWLAILFAIFGVFAGLLGIGTMTQINGITNAINMVFKSNSRSNIAFTILNHSYTWPTVIGGALVTICAALVIIGGLKRISKVAEKVVPLMAILYVFLGIAVLLMNATRIPATIALIFKSAFGFEAFAGGAFGWTLKQVADSMQRGISRGIFSNEAGLGSAPIAAATVKTSEPVEQGLVNMTGTIIDTLIVCSMTGISIVISLTDPEFFAQYEENGWKGIELTAHSLSFALGGDGISIKFLLMLCITFFAFTSILGWNYYSEKCLEYIFNGNTIVMKLFRVLYIVAIAIGPYLTVNAVFTIADITNAFMAIPNCISLLALSGVVSKECKDYFSKYPKLR